jgi:hypothetical protein
MGNEEVYPVKVIETFNILGASWNDFVCVWTRTDIKETDIIIQHEIKNKIGILEKQINIMGFETKKKC